MEKISILFLSSEPSNAVKLRLGEEFREIQEKLQLSRERELFELHVRTSVRPQDITQALLDVQPQIVHFSGHGTDRGCLCFEDSIGEIHPIPIDALEGLFKQFRSQIKLVILNACYSDMQAQAISKHIDHVIGMSKSIGDRAAIAFSIGFYQALGAGRKIEDAFEFGCIQVNLQNIPEHKTPILVSSSKTQDQYITKEVLYGVFLGERLRTLREDYLKISGREMAGFLDLETVSELDKFETGKEELPRKCIKEIEEFFFVDRNFLETGKKPVFRSFYVFNKQILNTLFKDGFKPIFLSKPRPRDGLYAFPVLWKKERGFLRIIATNLSSFHDYGGGKFNILQIINLMLEYKIGEQEVLCVEITSDQWFKLEDGSFFCPNIHELGHIDYECQEILHLWYRQEAAKQKLVSKARILWVDDHPEENIPLVNFFQSHGFEVTTARSTAEAIVLLNYGEFNHIISDMGREEYREYNPEAGLSLIRQVREDAKQIPIVIYTTHNAVAKYKEDAIKAGATAIVSSDSALIQIFGMDR
jgi:CheY-like chemotaxis protein